MKVSLLLLLVVLLGLVAIFALKKRGAQGGADGPWPFYAKRPLSAPEQVLYHRLAAALPDHIVLAQVQVSRVLGVKKGFNHQQWNNRINRLSYDFVVCGKDSTVLAAIELDDKTHESASRTETDEKKDKATSAAGIRLLRWHVKSIPDAAAIRAEFGKQSASPPSVPGNPAVTAPEKPRQRS